MNVVHKWECSLPSNYKKWTIKMGFFYIRYFITNNHFANDEILRIKIIRSYITKIVMMTLHIMIYHVRPTYRDSFNYTWAKWLTDLALIATLYRSTDLSNFFK